MDRRKLKMGRGLLLSRNVQPATTSQRSTGNREASPAEPEPEEAKDKSPVLSKSTVTPKKRRSDPKSTPQKRTQSSDEESSQQSNGNVFKRPRADQGKVKSQSRFEGSLASSRRALADRRQKSLADQKQKAITKRTARKSGDDDDDEEAGIFSSKKQSPELERSTLGNENSFVDPNKKFHTKKKTARGVKDGENEPENFLSKTQSSELERSTLGSENSFVDRNKKSYTKKKSARGVKDGEDEPENFLSKTQSSELEKSTLGNENSFVDRNKKSYTKKKTARGVKDGEDEPEHFLSKIQSSELEKSTMGNENSFVDRNKKSFTKKKTARGVKDEPENYLSKKQSSEFEESTQDKDSLTSSGKSAVKPKRKSVQRMSSEESDEEAGSSVSKFGVSLNRGSAGKQKTGRNNESPEISPAKIILQKERNITKRRKIVAEETSPETPRKERFSLRLTPSPRKKTLESPMQTRAGTLKNKDASSESLVFSENEEDSPGKLQGSGTCKSKSPKKAILRNKLGELFCEAGITLIADDSPHQLAEDAPTIVQKLENLMKTQKKYKQEDIVEQWRRYIKKTENLRSALNEMKLGTDQEALTDFNKKSLVKVLLHVPLLQKGVIVSLVDRLTEAVLEANSPDDVPWSSLMLQQFRFLEEIVDEEGLAAKFQELLDVSPSWFQRELIPYLTQIITESQHHALAEMLIKMLEEKAELTAVILDCVSNLSLSKDYLEELRDKVLRSLKSVLELNTLPATARFVLSDCNTQEVRMKTLNALRSVDMKPLVTDKPEDCFTNQVLTVTELRMAILRSKPMAEAALQLVQGLKKGPNPLDLVLLLLTYSTGPAKKKNVENILRKRVRSGFFSESLLANFYNDYQEVARELQSASISLASQLLKSAERVYADYAVNWFRQMFISQAQVTHKQREILEKIILLMGTDDQTAKNALTILSKMAAQPEEQKHLQAHCNHLRILLEKVDDLRLGEAATLSDLLHGLCARSSSTSDALMDDLNILLNKQLSHSKPLTKCKGVLGAVMAIKHLAVKPETCREALTLFKRIMTAVKRCSRSRALFYDKIAEVIETTENIESIILENFFNHCVGDLLAPYIVESMAEYRGELTPQFGLNTTEEEGEKETIISFGDSKDGAALPALFRFLKISCLRKDGCLQEIDSLLGCRVLMPNDLQDPDSKVVDLIFLCINWFREVISGFVKQDDPALQEKLLRRLDQLMELQGDLTFALGMIGSQYHPPICYFDHFPTPPFVRVEKKSGKKGKKANLEKTSGGLAEWASWEMGSALTCKNPAYFRRFDAEVAHLLGFNMDVGPSQMSTQSISIAQVCFIIKELLGMLENEASPSFMKDLVLLLPKVCTKLQQVTEELRENEEDQNREGAKLLLNLLAAIFNWKGFQNAAHYSMLRGSLRIVASQVERKNKDLRSAKELVAESFKYFESLTEVATRMSLAVALVNVCQALIQHSESWAQEHNEKLAKMAYGFLCLEWPNDKNTGSQYRTAVSVFLKTWIRTEPDPLKRAVEVLEWLPEEAARLEKQHDSLARLPSVNRNNFSLLLRDIFVGLIEGVKKSLAAPDNRDPDRIRVWQSVATGVQKTVQVCKSLKTKGNLLLFLQRMPHLLKLFIDLGMPVLEHNLKYQMDEVTRIVKLMQEGTKYLHTLCCHSRESKDTALAKFVPNAKSTLERLVFSVKGMLVLNNSPEAFWMGQLRNKDLEGKDIISQSSASEEQTNSTADEASGSADINDTLLSDDLYSDQEEEDDESECL